MGVKGFHLTAANGFAESSADRLLTECGLVLSRECCGALQSEYNLLELPGFLLEDDGLVILEGDTRALQES